MGRKKAEAAAALAIERGVRAERLAASRMLREADKARRAMPRQLPKKARPLCGALCRSGKSCQARAVAGGRRCRMHGGTIQAATPDRRGKLSAQIDAARAEALEDLAALAMLSKPASSLPALSGLPAHHGAAIKAKLTGAAARIRAGRSIEPTQGSKAG